MAFNPAYFYESGKVRVNTYIGGIGASASTKELLATKLGIASSRISNFSIINNNVQCRISGSYILQSSSSLDDTNITYYLDKGGLISNLTQYEFRRAINFNGELILDGVSSLTDSYLNRNGYLVRVICKNATTLAGAAFYNGDSPYFRQTFYFPNVTNMGGSTASNSVFYGIMPKSYIYVHPSMATNNVGGPDGDLVAATTAGAIVRYVTDFTLPEPISDVSVGVIHSTSVELIFTEPYAANTIDYYDVYIDGTYNCSCKYGQVYAQGLNPNTTYRIEVYAVDMFFNRSISNAVYATTSSTLGFVSTWDTTKTSSGSSTSTQIKLPLTSNGTYKFSVDWGDGTSNNITGWNDVAATHTYLVEGVYTITITGKCRGWVFGNSGDRLKILSVSSWGTLNIGYYQINQGGHFYGCANLDLSTVSDQLCLHRVYTLANSFQQCTSITSINNINTWVMGNIESLYATFYGNVLFNQELNIFTKYVANMDFTFFGCSVFNNGLPSGNPGTMSWNTSSATSMSRMFNGASSFNCNIGSWNVSSVSNFYGMFSGAAKFNNGGSSSIGSWQTTSATNMYQMFYGATIFNQPLSGWNTQNVTTMFWMFRSANAFNQSLSSWNTQNVTTMSAMFYGAASFNNGLLSGATGSLAWNTGSVTTMDNMFDQATSFNCDIGSWDVSKVESFSSMLSGAVKFNNGENTSINNWTLKTTGTVNLYGMFLYATAFNQPVGNWNTSAVTNMSLTFANASLFNQDLSLWKTGSVTTMSSMFSGASVFNNGSVSGAIGDLAYNPLTGAWNTENVTSMYGMFFAAVAFNKNIGSWNVSKVADFTYTFYNAIKFNNGGSATIGTSWILKSTGPITLNGTFLGATSFNQPLDGWNTSTVTTMSAMFYGATSFNNGLLSGATGSLAWNTSNVTDMGYMFNQATSFNCNIGSWNVSAVATFESMFYCYSVSKFNNGESTDINNWTIKNSGTVSMRNMFGGASVFDQNIGSWNVSYVTDFTSMFSDAVKFNNGGSSSIGNWTLKTTGVVAMYAMFRNAVLFNQPLNGWNTMAVSNMGLMFLGAANFNNGLGSGTSGTLAWNTSNVTDMGQMFNLAAAFNCVIDSFDVSKVTTFLQMFRSATLFNQPLNSWNTQAVTTMGGMFYGATNFNNGLSSGVVGTLAWNTSAVTSMDLMFSAASSFNCNIGSWNVSSVANFTSMFSSATKFNNGGSTAIETWTLKTTGTIDMRFMFYDTTIFNQPLNGWNTQAVTNMALMFTTAQAFNQPLNNWNTSEVTNMSQMFQNATAFDQNLGSWNVSKVTDFSSFMITKTPTTFSTANLDAIYNGWSTRSVLPSKSISFGTAKRTAASTSGRAILTSSPNLWTITDGGI